MRLTLSFLCTMAILGLVGCSSHGEGGALSTMVPQSLEQAHLGRGQSGTPTVAEPTNETHPTQTVEPIATLMPTAQPALPPTSMLDESSMPAPASAQVPIANPTSLPAAGAVPSLTPMPGPMQVALSKSLDGVARADGPLFSYENQEVYNKIRSLVSGQNSFVADFYRQLAGKADGNLFYSPYSLYTAMAVLYAGSAGDTAVEFQDVLGIEVPSDQFHRNLNSLDLTLMNASVRPEEEVGGDTANKPTLSMANGLWIQDGLDVLPGFLNTVTANYGIGLKQLDFRQSPGAAVAAIDQWVDQATQGKIKQAIGPASITPFTNLVVTNAVYFKGDWEDQFDEENTTDQPFYLLERSLVQVPMMFQSSDYAFRVGDGYQAVELPYTSGFSMLVVMPDEGAFEIFEESLTGTRLQEITDNLSGGAVILRMPRFKLEYSFSAKEGLQTLGLGKAFNRKGADFTPIAETLSGLPVEELWIEDTVQKAFVEVNEEGSEAAAATAFFGGGTAYSVRPPPVEITIDRPFLFLLRHTETGAVLFMGRVLNPDPEAPTTFDARPPVIPTPTPTEPPPFHATFFGVATLNGTAAPVGTEIRAYDGDRKIGRALVGDDGEFNLNIVWPKGPITFKVGEVDARESVPEWITESETVYFNLTAGGSS